MGAVATTTYLKKIRASEAFHVESAKVDFAFELKRLMDQKCLNNSRLADLLGVSKPMISKLLRGDANVTIETMAKAAYKLDSSIMIRIVRHDEVAHLFKLARCGESLRGHDKHHGKVSRPVSNVFRAGWNYSANETVEDEVLPVAA